MPRCLRAGPNAPKPVVAPHLWRQALKVGGATQVTGRERALDKRLSSFRAEADEVARLRREVDVATQAIDDRVENLGHAPVLRRVGRTVPLGGLDGP